MGFISFLLIVAALAFLCMAVAGVIRPAWFANKKTGTVPSRLRLGLAGLAWGIVLTAFAAIVLPEEQKTAPAKHDSEAQANSGTPDDGDHQQGIIKRLSGMTGDQLDTSNIVLPDCEKSSQHVSIETMSWNETQAICEKYAKKFGHPPEVRVIRRVGKVASLLSIKGYESGSQLQIATSVIQIMRDRGQSDAKIQMSTADLIWKMESAWDGAVSIADLHNFLQSSGDMAHTLSDAGLAKMAAMIKAQKAGLLDN